MPTVKQVRAKNFIVSTSVLPDDRELIKARDFVKEILSKEKRRSNAGRSQSSVDQGKYT